VGCNGTDTCGADLAKQKKGQRMSLMPGTGEKTPEEEPRPASAKLLHWSL
jgi:hypothetical protein